MSCILCHHRKEKRFCLAVHDRICPQCCGEQREVTLDCPAECPYLQQARQHVRRPAEISPEEMFPQVEISEQFLHDREPLILGISHTLAKAATADRTLNDREVIGALTNLIKSYQTLIASGIVYQAVLPNPVQQSLIKAIEKLMQEFRELEQQHFGYRALKDIEVLKVLVFLLRLAYSYTSGRPRSRGFLDFLHSQFPEATATLQRGAESGSRIILP